MEVKEFLKDTTKINIIGMLEIRPRLVCNDGFSISVQASEFHHCEPTVDLAGGNYRSVELGYPNREEELLNKYIECKDEPTETIYSYVPVEIIEKVIKKHGGIKK